MEATTHAAMSAVSSSVAADSVHERIRDSILSGELRPNARLVEGDLAAWLGVSRTPVREALLRLTQEGLVARSRGWIVREHPPEEFLRILEARAATEGGAAALAARNITEAELAELRELLDGMEHPDASRTQVNELNKRFHQLVTEASRNYLLVQFAQRTRISYWNFTLSSLYTPEDTATVNAQHREIVERLAAGDAEGSERAVRAHIERTRAVLGAALGLS
ncbi:DNA-binding GntR family transcriptional regulator [Homoserinimonas aerilata]|uniref:DNA-binding GntR family transcriptional regulator n=1 Tax=Homoserinimonas aerilata TaxID=1162970 RepID=A0A542YI42_9MICO|nr:GntR family transcriptional regulator [Homoserinimonas aerilata]TQL47745.1 DNA-binding GntR family transcriptional regulator [Homoserinimonas aerilata]